MKPIILNLIFFTVLFTCFSSFAQLEQGTFILREHFIFATSNYERDSPTVFGSAKSTTKEYNLYSSFGYLIKENQEIGISLGFGKYKYDAESTALNPRNNSYITRNNISYGFSLYYKKYHKIIDKLYFYVSPEMSYRHTKGSTEDKNSLVENTLSNQIATNIYTGFLYRPTPKFGLSMNLIGAGINYSSYIEEGRESYKSKNNSFSTNIYNYFGFNALNLGIQFML